MGKKIAVKINNEKEYKAFEKHLIEIGFTDGFDKHFDMFNIGFNVCQYCKNPNVLVDVCVNASEYEVISFESFAILKGIDLSPDHVTIQTSTTDIRVILGKDTFDVWESDSLVVGFTPEEVTEIFTAMQAFK